MVLALADSSSILITSFKKHLFNPYSFSLSFLEKKTFYYKERYVFFYVRDEAEVYYIFMTIILTVPYWKGFPNFSPICNERSHV